MPVRFIQAHPGFEAGAPQTRATVDAISSETFRRAVMEFRTGPAAAGPAAPPPAGAPTPPAGGAPPPPADAGGAPPPATPFVRSFSPIIGLRLTPSAIEVGSAPPVQTFLRDGNEVTPPRLDAARVEDFLQHTSVIDRIKLPVAVGQSIQPGTMVAKGTQIDVVFMLTTDFRFDLFQHVHEDFKVLTVADALPVVSNPDVVKILAKDNSAQVTDAEKKVITDTLVRALPGRPIAIDETNPGKTFDLAFRSLKSAQAFR